jgi:hypothetical protein
MACRHAAVDAVALALRHGGDPGTDDCAPVAAAAAGPGMDDCADADRTHADYERALLQLLDAGPSRAAVLAAALPAAAAADNVAMLDFLLAQGADLRADDHGALAAAARHMAFGAVERLLERGVDPRTDGDGAILATAVASLDETMVEEVLAAGVDSRRSPAAALRAAFESQPWDLYSAENDFVRMRADVVALLLRHGARSDDDGVIDALTQASRGRRVVQALLGREDIDADGIAFVESLARQAFGSPEDTEHTEPAT